MVGYRPPQGSPWFNGRSDLLPGVIVIHGDLGPWNMILDDEGDVAAIIDWNFVPGFRS